MIQEEVTEGPALFFGVDLSLNHYGAVAIDENGILVGYKYLTPKAKYHKADPCFSHFLKGRDRGTKHRHEELPDSFKYRRRDFVTRTLLAWIEDVIVDVDPLRSFANIEHYAFGSHTNTVVDGAEVGGIVRQGLYDMGVSIRETSPPHHQKWISKVRCSKQSRIENVPEDIKEYIAKPSYGAFSKSLNDIDGPVTDLVDAYWLAHMILAEQWHYTRQDEITEILSPNQLACLQSTTKRQLIPLHNRPFVTKP